MPIEVGRLQVTITAGTTVWTPNNQLEGLRFGPLTNAVVEIRGRVDSHGNLSLALPPDTKQVAFVVGRVTPGAASLVPIVVVDSCGEWPTFVGGGADAF